MSTRIRAGNVRHNIRPRPSNVSLCLARTCLKSWETTTVCHSFPLCYYISVKTNRHGIYKSNQVMTPLQMFHFIFMNVNTIMNERLWRLFQKKEKRVEPPWRNTFYFIPVRRRSLRNLQNKFILSVYLTTFYE